MEAWIDTLSEVGGELALGATVVLVLGALAARRARGPRDEQRMLETTMIAVLLWLPIGLVPIARWTPAAAAPEHDAATRPAVASTITPTAAPLSPSAVAPHARLASDAASEAAPAPSAPAAAPIDAARLTAAVYLAGLAAASVLLAVGAWRLARSLRSARRAPPHLVDLLADEHAAAGDNGRVPDLRVAVDDRHPPYCAGVARPVIVIPPRVADLPERDLRAVLRHELAHVQRGDVARRWTAVLCSTLLWFHPLVWWIRRRHTFVVEVLADARAAGGPRRARLDYARALLAVADAPHASSPLGAPSVFDSPSSLTRRMTMLIDNAPATQTTPSATRRFAPTAVAAVALVALGGFLGATPPAPAPQDATTILTSAADDAELDALLEQQDRLTTQLETLRRAVADLEPQVQRDVQADVNAARVDALLDDVTTLETQLAPVVAPATTATVEVGDSLASILRRNGLPLALVDEVARLNGLNNPRRLAVGQTLRLPATVLPTPAPAAVAAPAPRPAPLPAVEPAPAPAPVATPILDASTLDMVVRLINLEAAPVLPEGFESQREIVTRQRTIDVLRLALDGELRATDRELQRVGNTDPVARERLMTRLEILMSVVGG